MTSIRWLLWGLGLLLAAFGLLALFQPTSMMSPVGLQAPSPQALTEIRAAYGGLQIGLGSFLLWSALDGGRWPAALLAYALALGAVGDCRAVGLLIDREPTGFHVFALAFEWITAGVAFFAYHQLTRVRARGSESRATTRRA